MMDLPKGTHEKSKLIDINPNLTCYLCKGYYIDATTISECLHSFCRSCIITFLHENSYCPICEVLINKAKPNLKLDKTLQDIVYKLVPELFLNEMKRRQRFYQNHPDIATKVTPEARGEDTERTIFNPRDTISLSIEYISDDSTPCAILISQLDEKEASDNKIKNQLADSDENSAIKRFLQCSGMCRIEVLKKFIRNKYNVDTNQYHIDILYKRVPLPDHYTLIDIAYIYSWKRNEPMKFFFKITDINLVTDNFDYLITPQIKKLEEISIKSSEKMSHKTKNNKETNKKVTNNKETNNYLITPQIKKLEEVSIKSPEKKSHKTKSNKETTNKETNNYLITPETNILDETSIKSPEKKSQKTKSSKEANNYLITPQINILEEISSKSPEKKSQKTKRSKETTNKQTNNFLIKPQIEILEDISIKPPEKKSRKTKNNKETNNKVTNNKETNLVTPQIKTLEENSNKPLEKKSHKTKNNKVTYNQETNNYLITPKIKILEEISIKSPEKKSHKTKNNKETNNKETNNKETNNKETNNKEPIKCKKDDKKLNEQTTDVVKKINTAVENKTNDKTPEITNITLDRSNNVEIITKIQKVSNKQGLQIGIKIIKQAVKKTITQSNAVTCDNKLEIKESPKVSLKLLPLRKDEEVVEQTSEPPLEIDQEKSNFLKSIELTAKSAVQSPSPQKPSLSKINSPKKTDLPKIKSPQKLDFSKIESPQKPDLSKIESPQKPELSKIESPQKPDLSKIESSHKPDLSKIESSQKPDLSKIEMSQKPDLSKIESSQKPDLPKIESPKKGSIIKRKNSSPVKNDKAAKKPKKILVPPPAPTKSIPNPDVMQIVNNVNENMPNMSKIIENNSEKDLSVGGNNLQALFDSYKINIPASLSVTVKNDKDDCTPSTIQKPVQNYIEILKIPDRPLTPQQSKNFDCNERPKLNLLDRLSSSLEVNKIEGKRKQNEIQQDEEENKIETNDCKDDASTPIKQDELKNGSKNTSQGAKSAGSSFPTKTSKENLIKLNPRTPQTFQKMFEEAIRKPEFSNKFQTVPVTKPETTTTTKSSLTSSGRRKISEIASLLINQTKLNQEKLENEAQIEMPLPPPINVPQAPIAPPLAKKRKSSGTDKGNPHLKDFNSYISSKTSSPQTVTSLHSPTLGLNYTVSVTQSSNSKNPLQNGSTSSPLEGEPFRSSSELHPLLNIPRKYSLSPKTKTDLIAPQIDGYQLNANCPMATQLQGMATQQQRMATPQQTMAIPPQRMTIPQQRMATQQQRTATQQQRTATPQQKMATPQQRMAIPEQRIATPQQPNSLPKVTSKIITPPRGDNLPLSPNQILEKYNIQNLAQLTANFNFPPNVCMNPTPSQLAAMHQALIYRHFEMQNHQNWLNMNPGPLMQYEKYLQSLSKS